MYERFTRNFNHQGLYVTHDTPEQEVNFRRLQQEIDEAYATLPLEGCTTGYDVLRARYCLVPPTGKVFKVTGKFSTELDGRYIEDYYSPRIDSYETVAELVENHPLYEALAEVDDDPEKRIGFMYKGDDWGEPYEGEFPEWKLKELKDKFKAYIPKYLPPRDFFGKQLCVEVHSNGKGERHVETVVFGQVEMWSDHGLLPIALPIAESDEEELYVADVKTHMHWSREIAAGAVGSTVIEVCDEPEEFREFVLAEDRSRVKWDELWTPYGFNTTSHKYMNIFYRGFQDRTEWLEGARLYEMRRHRAMGMPFADDPSPYFRIPTSKEESYYTRQKLLRQVVTPRPTFAYYDGIVRETTEETLTRYIGRTITPEAYGKSLKAFDEKGRFRGDPGGLEDIFDEEKARLAKVKKRLYAAGGTFFYLEKD